MQCSSIHNEHRYNRVILLIEYIHEFTFIYLNRFFYFSYTDLQKESQTLKIGMFEERKNSQFACTQSPLLTCLLFLYMLVCSHGDFNSQYEYQKETNPFLLIGKNQRPILIRRKFFRPRQMWCRPKCSFNCAFFVKESILNENNMTTKNVCLLDK